MDDDKTTIIETEFDRKLTIKPNSSRNDFWLNVEDTLDEESIATAAIPIAEFRAALDKIDPPTLDSQRRNEQRRIDHIHEQDSIIRRRNETIQDLEKRLRDALAQAPAKRVPTIEDFLALPLNAEIEFSEREVRGYGACIKAIYADPAAYPPAYPLSDGDMAWRVVRDGDPYDFWVSTQDLIDAGVVPPGFEPGAGDQSDAVVLRYDDITDELAGKVSIAYLRSSAADYASEWREALIEGMGIPKPEPVRPEGAQDLESLLDDLGPDLEDGLSTAALADLLADRGVRIPA